MGDGIFNIRRHFLFRFMSWQQQKEKQKLSIIAERENFHWCVAYRVQTSYPAAGQLEPERVSAQVQQVPVLLPVPTHSWRSDM